MDLVFVCRVGAGCLGKGRGVGVDAWIGRGEE